MISRRIGSMGLVLFVMVFVSGCGGPTTAINLGAKVVGKAVDESKMAEYREKLLGQPPSAADAEFGERKDVLRDTKSKRYFLIYGVEMDPLDKNRVVVEVGNEKIIAITKVAKGGSKIDIPRKLTLKDKVVGKPPAECQRALEMGPPKLTVKRDSDGTLAQLYDAGVIKSLDKEHYCLLKYDKAGLCSEIDFVQAGASTKD